MPAQQDKVLQQSRNLWNTVCAGLFPAIGAGAALAAFQQWSSLSIAGRGLVSWLLIEALFYFFQCWRHRHTSAAIATDARIDPEWQPVVEERLLGLGKIHGIEDFLSGWFHGAPFESLKKGNVEDFISYGFYAKRTEDLTEEEKARGLAYIAEIEQTFQLQFEEGRNPDVEFMAHLWEPLRWLHKPLAVYMLAECMGLVTNCLLHALGFRVFRHHNGVRYWMLSPLVVRKAAARVATDESNSSIDSSCMSSGSASCTSTSTPWSSSEASGSCSGSSSPGETGSPRRPTPTGLAGPPGSPAAQAAQTLRRLFLKPRLDFKLWDRAQKLPLPAMSRDAPENSPIFFLHGVGFGLTPYLHFIHELMRAFPTRPIILLEARHVSVCLHWRALTTDQMAHAAQEILHKHGWDQAAFIGHSYGTFVMSRIAQLHQSIVQSMVLIDPVCMLTIYPQLLRNFVYKGPNFATISSLLGIVDSLRFVFSRDLMVAESFCRKFVWHRECLWPEELPEACMLVLAGEDDLVPSALVKDMLHIMNHPCEVLYHPAAGHGGFLLSSSFRRQVLTNTKVIVTQGADLACKRTKTQGGSHVLQKQPRKSYHDNLATKLAQVPAERLLSVKQLPKPRINLAH